MNDNLKPVGERYCYEQLSYVDTTNNIKLTARFTANASNGKIVSIENGEITIDAIRQGDFRSETMNMYNSAEAVSGSTINVSINNVNMYYIGLVGTTVAAMIVSAETYFKPVTEASGTVE